ncbi:uncharacterized protein JN550_010321 [Neoarthrinium moseri]|uniref:uncharacterized protein n=1 Tax=Neoarthrinium moseri TaxID=1658444 RepID=UPI001FDE6DEF|nr:uncharacterized protein JN550_010321 [Neoarthrinium moseri]KAI1862314.1 hypothetical protein JN550_010321 [Neoarthrinium moseri]
MGEVGSAIDAIQHAHWVRVSSTGGASGPTASVGPISATYTTTIPSSEEVDHLYRNPEGIISLGHASGNSVTQRETLSYNEVLPQTWESSNNDHSIDSHREDISGKVTMNRVLPEIKYATPQSIGANARQMNSNSSDRDHNSDSDLKSLLAPLAKGHDDSEDTHDSNLHDIRVKTYLAYKRSQQGSSDRLIRYSESNPLWAEGCVASFTPSVYAAGAEYTAETKADKPRLHLDVPQIPLKLPYQVSADVPGFNYQNGQAPGQREDFACPFRFNVNDRCFKSFRRLRDVVQHLLAHNSGVITENQVHNMAAYFKPGINGAEEPIWFALFDMVLPGLPPPSSPYINLSEALTLPPLTPSHPAPIKRNSPPTSTEEVEVAVGTGVLVRDLPTLPLASKPIGNLPSTRDLQAGRDGILDLSVSTEVLGGHQSSRFVTFQFLNVSSMSCFTLDILRDSFLILTSESKSLMPDITPIFVGKGVLPDYLSVTDTINHKFTQNPDLGTSLISDLTEERFGPWDGPPSKELENLKLGVKKPSISEVILTSPEASRKVFLTSQDDPLDIGTPEIVSASHREDMTGSSKASFSSGSTYDDGNDDGNDVVLVAETIDDERQRVLDSVMSEFNAWWSNSLGLSNHAGAQCSASSHSQGYLNHSTANSRRMPPSNRSHKRRRRLGAEEDEPDQSEDDEKGKRPTPTKPRALATQSTRRLGCPYFQRNPSNNRKHRACAGPGWETCHRVKEHVYRCHAIPLHCFRCHEVFDTESNLAEHQRQVQSCEVRISGIELQGLTNEQERLLRRRSKESQEEKKWKEMYRILFPDDREADMPSPYLELCHTQASIITEYDCFLRREVPSRVRQRIEGIIMQTTVPLEQELIRRIPEIVREVQLELFENYSGSGTQDDPETPATSPSLGVADAETEELPSLSGGDGCSDPDNGVPEPIHRDSGLENEPPNFFDLYQDSEFINFDTTEGELNFGSFCPESAFLEQAQGSHSGPLNAR